MRCRACGLELDERDQLKNGAYQCPECGTIHHTASSSRVSPSPWRRKRGNAFQSGGNVFTRKLWVLPLWSWIAVALVIIAAIVLLIVFHPFAKPEGTGMPVAEDTPLTDTQTNSGDSQGNAAPLTDAEDALLAELDGQSDAQPQITPLPQTGETNVAINDFLVSFEWAMSYLNYTSSLNLVSEEAGADGALVRKYSYENWLDIVMILDAENSKIRSVTATAKEGESEDDTIRMTSAYVCILYGLDNTLTASSASTEVNSMIADESYILTRNGFTANLSHSESDGYTLEVVGKL